MNIRGKTPTQCLEFHINEIRAHIHNKQTCTNNARYSLVFFYSGHGKVRDEQGHGDWRPSFDEEGIAAKTIEEQVKMLSTCTKEPPCRSECV